MSLKLELTPQQLKHYTAIIQSTDMTGYYKPNAPEVSYHAYFDNKEPAYSRAISMNIEIQEKLDKITTNIQNNEVIKFPSYFIGKGNPCYSEELLKLLEKNNLKVTPYIECREGMFSDLFDSCYIVTPQI